MKPHTQQCVVQFTLSNDGSQGNYLNQRAIQLQLLSCCTSLVSCDDSLFVSYVSSQKEKVSESDSLVYSEIKCCKPKLQYCPLLKLELVLFHAQRTFHKKCSSKQTQQRSSSRQLWVSPRAKHNSLKL